MMDDNGFICHKEADSWVGWLRGYPEQVIRGDTLEELEKRLADISRALAQRQTPCGDVGEDVRPGRSAFSPR